MFKFRDGWNCTIFTKIGTKLRQKLEYNDQIETEEMILVIILTPSIITTTSLCHCHVARRQLDTWQFFYLKKIKKFKKNQKKNQKIEVMTHGTPFNAVIVPLTKKTRLRSNIPKQGPNWDEKKNRGIKLRFRYENGDQRHD